MCLRVPACLPPCILFLLPNSTGTGGARREVRGALAEAFLAYLQALPKAELEKEEELSQILSSVFSLLTAPKPHSPLDTLQVSVPLGRVPDISRVAS